MVLVRFFGLLVTAAALAPGAAAGNFTATGVRVGNHPAFVRVVVRLAAAGHRFKYLSYRMLSSPERLAIDLWKGKPPVEGAEITNDGCLQVTRYSVSPSVSMQGRELRPLFEHTVVVRVRDGDGRELAVRPLIAARGRWATSFRLPVRKAQIATLEASAQSAKDGSLECLVQVRVLLPGGR